MAVINDEIISEFLDLGRFKPIMAMTKDNFIEMQQFFLMKIIAAHPDGITAYQLKNEYQFPRSKAIRHLSDLEEKGFMQTEEKILDGRVNKFYILSPRGFNRLAELKTTWKERFAMMDELTSNYLTQAEKQHYLKKLLSLPTCEGKIDYLKTMKANIEARIVDLDRKQKVYTALYNQLSVIIDNIDEMNDDLSTRDLENFFNIIPGGDVQNGRNDD